MTKEQYSSSTQAVSNAANEAFWDWGDMRPSSNNIAAAALRAAVDAVVDESTPGQSVWGEGFYEGVCSTCDNLLEDYDCWCDEEYRKTDEYQRYRNMFRVEEVEVEE
jgi:hypothetical protein